MHYLAGRQWNLDLTEGTASLQFSFRNFVGVRDRWEQLMSTFFSFSPSGPLGSRFVYQDGDQARSGLSREVAKTR